MYFIIRGANHFLHLKHIVILYVITSLVAKIKNCKLFCCCVQIIVPNCKFLRVRLIMRAPVHAPVTEPRFQIVQKHGAVLSAHLFLLN